jgi:hypothetical protein
MASKTTYLELFEEWFKIKNFTRAECIKLLALHIYNTIIPYLNLVMDLKIQEIPQGLFLKIIKNLLK